jgi:ATP-binding protein involved in chromosome partitioning
MSLSILEIWQKNERTLGICWNDNKEQEIDVALLREKCPCALCVDELSGVPKDKSHLDLEKIRPTCLSSVGHYGVKIEFDDGHKTGIYSFEYLRSLQDR